MGILKNKYFVIGNILLLLAVIPLTLYIVKRQTDLKSKAAPTTTLSFNPTTASTSVGQSVALDVMVDPGQNVVSIVELNIQVDPDKFQVVSLEKNANVFPSVLKPSTINNDGSVTLSVTTASDVTKAVQTKTKVATLTLMAKAPTSGAASIVKFTRSGSSPTQVFSLATSDGATENVLNDVNTASITVSGAAQSSPAPTSATVPTCSALNLDVAASGTAPYAITFTGVGASSNGTVSKASFNFGDGTSQDVTSGGGIGTNTVNVQLAHTYSNAGTFSASVSFTDSNGGVSDPATCTKSIIISSAAVTPTSTESAQISPTISPTLIVEAPTATPSASGPSPTLPITGTFETTLTILGLVGTTIGIGLFLFIL